MGIKIRFSEDGMFVCASDMDGEIYVFQLYSKDIISRSENENAIVKCIWHPHDNQIVLLDGLGRIGTFPFLPFLSLFFLSISISLLLLLYYILTTSLSSSYNINSEL